MHILHTNRTTFTYLPQSRCLDRTAARCKGRPALDTVLSKTCLPHGFSSFNQSSRPASYHQIGTFQPALQCQTRCTHGRSDLSPTNYMYFHVCNRYSSPTTAYVARDRFLTCSRRREAWRRQHTGRGRRRYHSERIKNHPVLY